MVSSGAFDSREIGEARVPQLTLPLVAPLDFIPSFNPCFPYLQTGKNKDLTSAHGAVEVSDKTPGIRSPPRGCGS